MRLAEKRSEKTKALLELSWPWNKCMETCPGVCDLKSVEIHLCAQYWLFLEHFRQLQYSERKNMRSWQLLETRQDGMKTWMQNIWFWLLLDHLTWAHAASGNGYDCMSMVSDISQDAGTQITWKWWPQETSIQFPVRCHSVNPDEPHRSKKQLGLG